MPILSITLDVFGKTFVKQRNLFTCPEAVCYQVIQLPGAQVLRTRRAFLMEKVEARIPPSISVFLSYR